MSFGGTQPGLCVGIDVQRKSSRRLWLRPLLRLGHGPHQNSLTCALWMLFICLWQVVTLTVCSQVRARVTDTTGVGGYVIHVFVLTIFCCFSLIHAVSGDCLQIFLTKKTACSPYMLNCIWHVGLPMAFAFCLCCLLRHELLKYGAQFVLQRTEKGAGVANEKWALNTWRLTEPGCYL